MEYENLFVYKLIVIFYYFFFNFKMIVGFIEDCFGFGVDDGFGSFIILVIIVVIE